MYILGLDISSSKVGIAILDKDENIDDIQYYINILSKEPYKIKVTPREVVYAAEQLGLVQNISKFDLGRDPNEEPWTGGSARITQQRDPDDPMWSRGWYEDDYPGDLQEKLSKKERTRKNKLEKELEDLEHK